MNPVRDLKPLAGLKHLRKLIAAGAKITDLSPLADLTNLTSLAVQGNMIRSVEPLAKLTNLRDLLLGGNRISDIKPLAGLPLEILDLSANPIADLSPLLEIRTLRLLNAQRILLTPEAEEVLRALEERGVRVFR